MRDYDECVRYYYIEVLQSISVMTIHYVAYKKQ